MRILVGISGGLDSAYAAMKLQREGHEVEGAILVMHDFTDLPSAQEVASSIGIKLHVIDCREMFSSVVDNFVSEYSKARTPNPCIVCNPLVKFKALYDYAMQNGFDRIATGHYANIVKISRELGDRYALERSSDEKKDQTYMLYRLPQEILGTLYFPLGNEIKSDVRESAKERGLAVAEKKESQEICFIPDGDYASFIEEKVGKFPEGDFVDEEGKIIGRHKGIIRYTYGQRKGLGVAAGERIFVTGINPENNTVTLSKNGGYTDTVEISDTVFSGIFAPSEPLEMRATVKLRYQARPIGATVLFDGNGRATVKLDEPQRAVTPGQSAVLYEGNTVLCGGFII